MAKAAPYDVAVFINCPFDAEYKPLFEAMIFAVFHCGFVARSAQEIDDSGQVRIGKIFRIIDESRFGIHDISCTELDPVNQLPRFNMPLELGIFLGAMQYGPKRKRNRACLVLDREPYRYQKFVSDIAGQDIKSHGGSIEQIICKIRDWLSSSLDQNDRKVPSGSHIASRYKQFLRDLPMMCAPYSLTVAELTFSDLSHMVSEWLQVKSETA